MNNQSGSSILQVEGLNVFYGAFQAVSDVSFKVKSGEIFGLLGPNGAGKTSTLSAVEGLIKPQSGEIFVAGFDISKQPLTCPGQHGSTITGNQLSTRAYNY